MSSRLYSLRESSSAGGSTQSLRHFCSPYTSAMNRLSAVTRWTSPASSRSHSRAVTMRGTKSERLQHRHDASIVGTRVAVVLEGLVERRAAVVRPFHGRENSIPRRTAGAGPLVGQEEGQVR